MTGDFSQILIGRFPAAAPIVVVIENYAAALDKLGQDALQAGQHRLISVDVDMGKGYGLVDLHRVLHQPFDQRHGLFVRVDTKASQVGLDNII